jgi:syndecan 2
MKFPVVYHLLVLCLLHRCGADWVWDGSEWVWQEEASAPRTPFDDSSSSSAGAGSGDGDGGGRDDSVYVNPPDDPITAVDDEDRARAGSGDDGGGFVTDDEDMVDEGSGSEPTEERDYSEEYDDDYDYEVTSEETVNSQSTPDPSSADDDDVLGGAGQVPKQTPPSKKVPDGNRTSFFAQPGILAAVVGGAVVGLLCAILFVMFVVYRMRKKDEGSYPLDEPKRSPTVNTYSKQPSREFYA